MPTVVLIICQTSYRTDVPTLHIVSYFVDIDEFMSL